MKKLLLISLLLLVSMHSFAAVSRLKDVITVKGVRDNPIIGYGLVIGLNGTGDGGGEITNNSLKLMFEKLGLNPKREVSSKNVASVVVTAKLPPFGRVGQKIDVVVSSIGDASSLAGGTLLVTPMRGGDDRIYAIANGGVSIGGLTKGAKFATTGTIPNGATIEREIAVKFHEKKALRLSLRNPDFTTAARVEKVINSELGGKFAMARDATTVDLMIPTHYQRKVVQLMAIIENFKVNTDKIAKIVVNERTGTIVAGGDITLQPAAISHGDLSIEIGGENTKAGSLFFLDKKTTLKDLVKALNGLGTTSEDLISIFQALKRNGALVGEIELI